MEESFLQHAGYKELKDKYPCFIEQVELAELKIQRNLEEIEPRRGPTKPVSVKSHYKRSESKDSGIQSLSSSADSEGSYKTSDWVKDDIGKTQNRPALNDNDDDETVPKKRHDIAVEERRDMSFPGEDHDRPEKLTRGEDNVGLNSCLKLTLKLGKLFNKCYINNIMYYVRPCYKPTKNVYFLIYCCSC